MISTSFQTRNKWILGVGLAVLSGAAWLNLFLQSRLADQGQAHMASMHPPAPGLALILYLSTWMVMIVAMMLPAAGPMIQTYSTVISSRGTGWPVQSLTVLFVLGYLLAWAGLGLAAYTASAILPAIALNFPNPGLATEIIGAAILFLAGAYQFSPLKERCLSACRTPFGYVLSHWREGMSGALRMGMHHGLYCIGCCWALMAIMVLAGSMDLAWMAGLALVMFVEKVSRWGAWFGKTVGIALMAAGFIMVILNLG